MHPRVWTVFLASGLFLASAGPMSAAEATAFTDKVAPVLQRRCLGCHGEKKRGGLDLRTRAGMLKGGDGGPALVPGSAAKSRLVQLVSGPKPRMPREGPKLTPAEVAALRAWVDAGAPWPEGVVLKADAGAPVGEVWWSLRPLTKPPVPKVKDAAWVRTPVDAFVRAAQEAKGLRPAPEADRRTLIRRL